MKWEEQDFSLKRLLDQEPTQIDYKKIKTSISLSKSRNSSSQSSIKLETTIKDEKSTNLINVKTEPTIKDETQSIDLNNLKTEPQDIEYTNIDTSSEKTNVQSTYNCPLCNVELTHIKSSYFRQKHIEECLSSQEKQQQELEFDNCVFCGKFLNHFNAERRQLHLNRCLDGDDTKQEVTYAGQQVPFINDLDICPVCHEFGPFKNKSVNQKIIHIKQCSKQNKLCMNDLLKKFQWIGWGHVPLPSKKTVIPAEKQTPLDTPKHELVAYVQDSTNNHTINSDQDFNNQVFIHKRLVKASTSQDNDDEELQTALAISRSLKEVESLTRRKERIKPSDERDWNAANIVSMEESKTRALNKLECLLYAVTNQSLHQFEREKSIGQLGPSRLPSTKPYYWYLTSDNENSCNDSHIFFSHFLQALYNIKK